MGIRTSTSPGRYSLQRTPGFPDRKYISISISLPLYHHPPPTSYPSAAPLTPPSSPLLPPRFQPHIPLLSPIPTGRTPRTILFPLFSPSGAHRSGILANPPSPQSRTPHAQKLSRKHVPPRRLLPRRRHANPAQRRQRGLLFPAGEAWGEGGKKVSIPAPDTPSASWHPSAVPRPSASQAHSCPPAPANTVPNSPANRPPHPPPTSTRARAQDWSG